MIRDQIIENENVEPNTREIELLKKTFPQLFDKEGIFLQDRFFEMMKTSDVYFEKEGYELKFLGKSYARYLSSLKTETFLSPDIEQNNLDENKDSENLYIIGDNLDALKHLLNSYANKIKCIYIDPPYNTGSDGFVYPDNFKFNAKEMARTIGIDEDEAQRIIDLAGKSSHSAWLTFMYPRLVLARDLLSDDGVVFISIDDNEQANLKLICDEVFGEENFVSQFIWKKKQGGGNDSNFVVIEHESVLCYAKEHRFLALNLDKKYKLSDSLYPYSDDKGEYGLITLDKTSIQFSQSLVFEIKDPNGIKYFPRVVKGKQSCWRWGRKKVEEQYDELVFKNGKVYTKYYRPDGVIPRSLLVDPVYGRTESGNDDIKSLFETDTFSYPKPVSLMSHFSDIGSSLNSIILDFFSGSATTAHAVMKLNAEDGGNRKYIMVQLPEVIKEDKPAYQAGYRTIDEIGRERIRRAAKQIKDETQADIDYGFKTYRLETIPENTLNKMIDFDPTASFITEDMISVFDSETSSGLSSILATWMNEDGYGLTSKAEDYKLIDYCASLYNDSIYLINEGLNSKDVMELIKRLETMELDIQRVVVYPYSVEFNVMHELKKNIKNLRNNKSVEVIERY